MLKGKSMNNDWSTRNGWTETTLGEGASNIAYGFTESATLEKIGPKFLRITDIQNDFIDWNSVPYCPISEREHKKYKLEIGDVVIARTGNSTG
ncbi:MAG: type I restriction endonuclease subunit S, partial [Bacteroidetes bacterium CG18_big_fil_WC_8_21_14_2_50_41_14]